MKKSSGRLLKEWKDHLKKEGGGWGIYIPHTNRFWLNPEAEKIIRNGDLDIDVLRKANNRALTQDKVVTMILPVRKKKFVYATAPVRSRAEAVLVFRIWPIASRRP